MLLAILFSFPLLLPLPVEDDPLDSFRDLGTSVIIFQPNRDTNGASDKSEFFT